MGSYLNPGSGLFEMSLGSEIYVDKSRLIEQTNRCVRTQQRYMCVSRPRRFGKSMALDMLAAYYDRTEDTEEMFQGLVISHSESYRKHLNKYDVIRINMQEFLSVAKDKDEMLKMLKDYLSFELLEYYMDIQFRDEKNLVQVMKDIYKVTKRSFVILIDEWDCLFREYQQDKDMQKQYLDFLRAWLKDKDYVALVYMTGILPIKKYGSHSALNMFAEYSMTDPGNLAEFFGFTEDEVKALCAEYAMNYEEAGAWYNGYHLLTHGKEGSRMYAMYSPRSIQEAMLRHKYGTYWNQTETYEALKVYIQMNMDGLKDAVVKMLAGGEVPVNTGTFGNDMTTFATKDDVLTLLVHLGYLSYDSEKGTVAIPNKEVAQEYVNAVSTMDWREVTDAVQESRKLLEALWDLNSVKVAEGIDRAHEEISILRYNDENSLSCTINLAFYFAREYYTIVREMPAGKGFADICFIPRKIHEDKPAVVIELKWDKSAKGAIAQIREKGYVDALKEYHGNLILAGINYDKKTKKHSCELEKKDI
jgi:hypothetical protein